VLGPSTFASLGGLKQLAIGSVHACSLSKEGAVTCWGGLGKARAVPAPVRGIPGAAAALALGLDEGCALLDEGTVACFPLRNPAAGAQSRARFAAQKVVGARGVVAIAHGERHGCAVDMRGAVMCWGAGGSLELGRREEGGLGAAEVVPGIDQAMELALGDDFSCARRRDGTVWCWGRNDRGQLGDGSFADRAEPRVVPGLLGVTSLRAGSGHACALTGQKEVLCWGDNRMRQIRAGAALISTTGVTVAANAGASPQRAP
jgi:alpha-tubulin suppressor-like RCC1 family protein